MKWFRYVRHEDRAKFEAKGWAFAAELHSPHGHWSILMVWTGEGEPE
jgi:hypothetical protein